MQIKAAVPALPVADLSRSISFYRDVLRFDLVHREATFAILRHGPVELHLWLAGDLGWRTRPIDPPVTSGAESFLAGTASCRLQVVDVRNAFEQVRRQGLIHPNGGLADTAWGTTEFSLLDPDNNMITMYQPMRGAEDTFDGSSPRL